MVVKKATTAKRVLPARPPEETFYRIQLRDLEGGKIRFGPFTSKTPEKVVEDLRKVIQSDDASGGVENALLGMEIWGGFEVWLKGDDGTDVLICEVEAP